MKLKMLKDKKWQWSKVWKLYVKFFSVKLLPSEANRDHAVKAASFAKTLVEKESMLQELNMTLEKLEEEFKL